MEHVSKIQIGLFFLASLSLVFYYVLPATTTTSDGVDVVEIADEEEVSDWGFCRISSGGRVSLSAYGFITSFRENRPTVKDEEVEKIEIEEIPGKDCEKTISIKEKKKNKKGKEEKLTLFYEIIIILLLISVTISFIDCFHERKKIKMKNSGGGDMKGNRTEMCRRMSLADLTISRHARRESQASYRPPAGPSKLTLGLRSSSQETSQSRHLQPVSRQTSCPQNLLRRTSTVEIAHETQEDGGWAERRRVRMIQRH